MCGRGGLDFDWKTVWRYLSLAGDPSEGGEHRYNVAPSSRTRTGVNWQHLPAIRTDPAGRRRVDPLVWPLVPHWLKGELPKFSTANCRSEPDQPFSETVAGKPAFRNAWRRQQRCVVLLSWFYEWDQRSQPRQPWRVLPRDAPLLTLAGLWERSPHPEGGQLESLTLVTTGPNDLLRAIGHHRSPVVLHPDALDTWLQGSDPEAEALLRPPPDDALTAHRVDRKVNNPGYDRPDVIDEVDDDAA